jgi:hypothetical protein
LPVVDEVAGDYQNDLEFLAIAWKSDPERAAERASELFSDNLKWGIGDQIFSLYGIPGQPASVIVSDGVIVDSWFGAIAEGELRSRLDAAVAISSS